MEEAGPDRAFDQLPLRPPLTPQAQFLNELAALLDYVVSTWTYLLAYLLAGGAVLCWLETEADLHGQAAHWGKWQQLNLTDVQWEAARATGLLGSMPEEPDTVWTLTSAMFLLLTSITTIGYGSITPRTPWGMVFTTLYSLLGMGFVATTTMRTAEGSVRCLRMLLEDPRRKARQELEAKAALHFRNVDLNNRGSISKAQLTAMLQTLSHGQGPSNSVLEAVFIAAANDEGNITEKAFPLAVAAFYAETKGDPSGSSGHVLSIVVLLLLAVWVGAAALFSAVEGWTFVEAMWFGFATLTTCGFGDYVPQSQLGVGLAGVFIASGLGLGALFISATADAVEARQRRLDSSVRRALGPHLQPVAQRAKAFGWGLLPSQLREAVKDVKLA
eukprot:GGOE01019413.1.p1 GENE.GGOE01019413.1~~GGOE01019413.1.p1  ORF type:complete len:387 (-),score=125.66 GGOE01019413.1:158-1318(-)